MAGRPRLLKEDEMLEKATELFWENGYEATSMDELLACMNLNKGSLYYVFGSKHELFSKALDFFSKKFRTDAERTLKNAESPVQGIKDFFLAMTSSGEKLHKKGCFMGNTISELAGIDKRLTDKAVRHLKDLEDLFYEYVEKGKQQRELKTKEDSRKIARYLVTLWNGLNITRRMYPTAEALEPLVKMQLSVLV